MMLSKKELEVMYVLWANRAPMSATDIVEASIDIERTWKLKSIYIILNALLEKKAIVLSNMKPTSTNSAKAYVPTMTKEDYILDYVRGMEGLDMALLSNALKELSQEKKQEKKHSQK